MTPLERVLDVLTSLECKPRHSGTGWSSKCPAHPDKDPSLSVSEGSDGKVLLNCHAGCRHDDVAKSLGMTEKDLFPPSDEPPQRAQLVATYPYQDENGVVLYESLRYSPKTFRQRKPVAGGYEWSLNGVRRVPFRLPELLANVHEGETVFVVEGEKDVLSLVSRGFCATCNAGGADAKENKAEGTWQPGDGSKWRDDFAHYFKGADVVILPDNDGAGRAHAERVRRSLERQAKRIRVVDLPGLPEKGDVSDFFAAGHTAQELQTIVDAEPVPAKPAAPDFPWITPEAFRSELQTIAKTRRATGLADLDKALGGGLPGGVVIALVGPPGSCKSALAVQIGLDRARAENGILYVYSPDQGGTQPLSRLASTYGVVADDDEAWKAFSEGVLPFLRVADDANRLVTLESFSAAVEASGRAAAILLDTPQTVITADDDEGERARINAAMEGARTLAQRLLVPVLVPNHANRASSASKDKTQRTHARSAALGSAGVEHRAQVQLFMERLDRSDGSTVVDVNVTKVSFGTAGYTFRLSLNPKTFTLSQVDKEVAEVQDRVRDAETEAIAKKSTSAAVIELLKRHPDGLSGSAIEKTVPGRTPFIRTTLLDLQKAFRIFSEPRAARGGGLIWKLSQVPGTQATPQPVAGTQNDSTGTQNDD